MVGKSMSRAMMALLCLGLIVGGGCSEDHSARVRSEKVGPGVTKVTFGTPDKVNLLSELHVLPRKEALENMGDAGLPFDVNDIVFRSVEEGTCISFPLQEDERIYGLGLNFKSVNQRGQVKELHADHYAGKDNGRTHAPVPFYVSSRGYGVLVNSADYIKLWCGTTSRIDSPHQPEVRDRNTDRHWTSMPLSDRIEFLVPGKGVEVIFFSGPDMLDAVRRYNLYNGGGVLPPRWGLGFWQRTPSLYSQDQVLEEVAEFRSKGFPLSVIGLEPGWMSASYPCTYEWDPVRFPSPETLIDSLSREEVRTNLWINPYVNPQSNLGERIRPWSGSHSVWCGLVPDFMTGEARSLVMSHFEDNVVGKGVSGFKMDENDGYDTWLWPDTATFPSGTPAVKMRQLYGSLMQQMFSNLYRSRNQRTYGLVRAGNAGDSSFPFVLYNDYYDHRDFITALVNSSFIGVLWTPEARSAKSADDWLRRMQTACLSPLAMLNAWATGTKPWSFPEVEDQVLEASRLRIMLIPYLYTAFARYAFEGIPPMRAMYLEKAFTASDEEEKGRLDATSNPYAMAVRKDVKDQYMLGQDILVAPLFAGEKGRKVILPKGAWYDFYTGEYVGSGEVITVEQPNLGRIPMFVRDGSLIPLWPGNASPGGGAWPVEVRCYGSREGSMDLYDDDGETFGYESGDCTWITLRTRKTPDGKMAGEVIIPTGATLWSFTDFSFKFMGE